MTYVAGTVADGEVPVARHYELKTDELIGGVPRIQMLGDGPVALDASTGMPHHASLKAVLTSTWVGGSDKITITIDTRLIQATPAAGAPPLPGAQDASETQRSEGGPTVQQADTGPMPGHALPQPRGGQVCTDDEVKTFLAGLKSNQPNERIEAANALARSSADDDHAGGVARALVAALDNRDVGTREACVQALGVWATSETIPALIGALGDTDFSVRWMALDTLAPLKDPRSIGPIASRLEDGADRAKASAALLKFGAPAAEAVAKQLKSTDWETRMEACHLLKSIGNKAQIPLIEDLAANDPNGLVKLAASDALLTLNVNNVDE
jgi:hypothetical protein